MFALQASQGAYLVALHREQGLSSHVFVSERDGPMTPKALYEAIIVKLIFDLFHLLVRPAGDYLVVPT